MDKPYPSGTFASILVNAPSGSFGPKRDAASRGSHPYSATGLPVGIGYRTGASLALYGPAANLQHYQGHSYIHGFI